MPDVFSTKKRSQVMSQIKSKNTSIELLVRRWLFSRGYRYRVNVRLLPGKPDIVLKKYNTVVFIHGCFWHGHGGCYYSHKSKSNVIYWEQKILRNKERDLANVVELEKRGWRVYIVWECEVKQNLNSIMEELEKQLHNK